MIGDVCCNIGKRDKKAVCFKKRINTLLFYICFLEIIYALARMFVQIRKSLGGLQKKCSFL